MIFFSTRKDNDRSGSSSTVVNDLFLPSYSTTTAKQKKYYGQKCFRSVQYWLYFLNDDASHITLLFNIFCFKKLQGLLVFCKQKM